MKKTFAYFLLAILTGIIISKYIFSEYETSAKEKNKDNIVYLFQYQAYKDEDVMIENAKVLENYFYYKDNDMYHVIIGISKNKNNLDKIKKAYNINSEIYVKKQEISNIEFLTNLEEYDKLINKTTDKSIILNAEEQIMAKYKELILNNE